MGRRKKGEPPAYRKHKTSGLAYCTIGGRRVYLGPHGSRESRVKYRKIIHEWEEAHGRAELQPLPSRRGCTVEEMTIAFLDWANLEYRTDGEPSGRYDMYRRVLSPFARRYEEWLADDIRAAEILEQRERWLAEGLSRATCNQYCGMLRRVFAWAKDRGLVEASTLMAVTVEGLSAGRDTVESKTIDAAPEEHVLAVAQKRGGVLGAMLHLQNVVGMRPGEICRMRGREINREAKVSVKGRVIQLKNAAGNPATCWVFQPSRHKTKFRGKSLAYILGPKARELLTPWLVDDPEAYLFRTRLGGPYTTNTYNTQVRKVCDELGIPRFSCNQLRHATATRYEELAGIMLASKIMGHASPDMTLNYVHDNLSRAAEMVERYG